MCYIPSILCNLSTYSLSTALLLCAIFVLFKCIVLCQVEALSLHSFSGSNFKMVKMCWTNRHLISITKSPIYKTL